MSSKKTTSRPRKVYKTISVSPHPWYTTIFADNLVDLKDVQIREQTRKVEALEENCQDLDNTITQFRELVLQLQTCVHLATSKLMYVTNIYTAISIPSEHKHKQPSMNLLLLRHRRPL
jgi:hypothetical protein